HLLLSWLLLATTSATASPAQQLPLDGGSAIKEVALDMANSSFDDGYRGCSRWMWGELAELNATEFRGNQLYADAWAVATQEWRSRQGRRGERPEVLRPELATAILAYTWDSPLFQAFNEAVRAGGRSRQDYLSRFPFKVLHFLLTEALRLLGGHQGHRCHQVYRGVHGVRFGARRDQLLRLGHFASASLREEKARSFGQDTFFLLETCCGVPVRDFSFYSSEEEVLIPPYETFRVADVSRDGAGVTIRLRSAGATSTYNCEWLAEKRCRSSPCDFSSGWTLRGDPPQLWGLLLVAALAAAGSP
ncbi:NARE ribosyltransferase, partial [Rhinopomastus cyanomelas]|nr:NARE ribosyltransferase [Rhinopomastus cyanomelas]